MVKLFLILLVACFSLSKADQLKKQDVKEDDFDEFEFDFEEDDSEDDNEGTVLLHCSIDTIIDDGAYCRW